MRSVAKYAKWPEIERLAKTRAPEAIQTLSDIMLDKNENGATRVSAANAILDRGYGKPKTKVDVSGSIDVNAAHLHAIKLMSDQVNAETRLIAKEGKPLHEITIKPVRVSDPRPKTQELHKLARTRINKPVTPDPDTPDIFQ